LPDAEMSPQGSRIRPPPPRGLPIHNEPAHPPPFALPGEHFAAAFAWLGLGAAGLVYVAPSLARGNFLDPHALAVTHMITLGVITTSIFGALYQLFPVLLGVPTRSVRVGHAGFWCLATGTAALVAGLWWWKPSLLVTGWLLLFAAVGAVSYNLLPQRRKAKYGQTIGLYISGAHSFLGVAMFIALARIGEAAGWWTVDRLGLIASHLNMAAIGFAALTAVGVGSRMVPMFLQAHGAPGWPLQWIGPLAAVGLIVQGTGLMIRYGTLTLVGGLLLLATGGLYLYLISQYARHRTGPLDVGLCHVAVALCFFVTALVLGGLLLLGERTVDPRRWAAYGVTVLLGWLVMFIIGVYYRILPFLTWLHLQGPASKNNRVPRSEELLTPPLAWASLVFLTSGLVVLIASILLELPGMAQAGAAGFAVGVGLVVAHHLRLLPS